MTDEMTTLRTLLEKSFDADLLGEMIGFTAQRLMELEVEGLAGAAHGERSPERLTYRNRYATGRGRRAPATVELRIPKLPTSWSAQERAHRLRCGDHCDRRQQRRPARSDQPPLSGPGGMLV